MTTHIPPTEAELNLLIENIESGNNLTRDECAVLLGEIRHLRALCGRAARYWWRLSSIADEKIKRELIAASEGRK